MKIKLQLERKDMDYKAKMEDIRREGKMMLDRALVRSKVYSSLMSQSFF